MPLTRARDSALRVTGETAVLPKDRGPLHAGVNSFGITGSNVHLVLSSAPTTTAAPPSRISTADGTAEILTVTARSAAALSALSARYLDRVGRMTYRELTALCAASARRQEHGAFRAALTADSPESMTALLRDVLAGRIRAGTATCSEEVWARPRIVFVFPGQGSQWAGMGRRLPATHDVFRGTLSACDAVIREHTGWSPLGALCDGEEDWLSDTERVPPAVGDGRGTQ
ncbi:acyltransferase domain-containing protein [Streptomyces spectabilis]|uniref:acyltransferase domain-containing protein n=1 Tax=Streptomyces spectabilis TaxID=68270 RepID=UPI00340330FF